MDEFMKQHGAFSWNELMTTDLAGAKAFYAALFGWTIEDMPGGSMPYMTAKCGDRMVAGLMAKPPTVPEGVPPHWGAYVTVDDVDAAAQKTQELGGKTLLPPTDIPCVGRFCVIMDPQGAVLSLITYAADCK